VTILGGDLSAFVELMDSIRSTAGLSVRVTCKSAGGLGLAIDSVPPLPAFNTLASITDDSLVQGLAQELDAEMHRLGVDCYGSRAVGFRVDDRNISMVSSVSAIRDTENDILLLRGLMHGGKAVSLDLSIKSDPDLVRAPDDLNSVLRGAFVGEQKGQIPAAFGRDVLPSIVLNIEDIPYFSNALARAFRRRFFNDLVQRYLGHEGLIKVDMTGIREDVRWRADSSGVVALLNAGCHIISSGSDDIVSDAVRIHQGLLQGDIDPEEFRLKVESVLATRSAGAADTIARATPAALHRALFNPGMKILLKNIYKNTTVLQGGESAVLPFGTGADVYTATLTIGAPSSPGFRRMIDRYTLASHFFLPYYTYDPFKLERLEQQLRRFDHVIVCLYAEPYTVPDHRLEEFLETIMRTVNTVVVTFGENDRLSMAAPRQTWISSPVANETTESLIAQLIFGAAGYPFPLSSMADGSLLASYDHGGTKYALGFGLPEEHGMDSGILGRIDRIVREAIDMRATPGCQVLVARNGDIVFDRTYGYYTYDSIAPVTSSTLYDLASVTKVAATTQLVMMLYDRGLIDLDRKISFYLPALQGTNKADIVVRDVLAHQAGLRPFYPFWLYTVDDNDSLYYSNRQDDRYTLEVSEGMYGDASLRDSIWQWTMRTSMLRKRRGLFEYKYSDLGFYLLERLLEEVTGTTVDKAVDSLLYAPMGLHRITYRPMCRFARDEIAPTEDDRQFRPGLVWGTVHDQIAAMSGGVGGHAGLFGNATELAKIMMMNLQGGAYAGRQYIKKETIDLFTSAPFKDNRRGLGWDKPERHDDLNPVSRYASMSSYGHRGFTGTIVWADPTFNLIFVFLSNRVYPNARNTKLIDYNVRKRIQDLVYESIWDFEKYHYR
jgi:CubicO group peptidase (beta-lactamase class C family)